MAKARESQLAEAAAAAVATGAAAVGGKLAKDKLSASREREAARAYRLGTRVRAGRDAPYRPRSARRGD
jgi:hypothetical protein